MSVPRTRSGVWIFRLRLRDTYIGAVAVALLLTGAARTLILAIEQPVGTVLTRLVDHIIRRSYPASLGLIIHPVDWKFSLISGSAAIGLGVAGFILAFWLYRQAPG
jgi:hypothetical protein